MARESIKIKESFGAKIIRKDGTEEDVASIGPDDNPKPRTAKESFRIEQKDKK